jgi:hypothetical protein
MARTGFNDTITTRLKQIVCVCSQIANPDQIQRGFMPLLTQAVRSRKSHDHCMTSIFICRNSGHGLLVPARRNERSIAMER